MGAFQFDRQCKWGELLSNVLVEESYLQDIADSIRNKNGSADTYTPSQMAPAILALPSGSTPVLGTKVITYNGEFPANDDGLDGYSSVSVSRQPNLNPLAEDITNGYVDSGVFRIGGSYYSDVYEVKAGHTYLFEYGGSRAGTLFRLMFTTTNTAQASSNVSGTSIVSTSGSSSSSKKWTATGDGYVTWTKGGSSGRKSYAFDMTLTEDL